MHNENWKLCEKWEGKAERKNGWKNCSAAIEYIAQGYVICTYCLFGLFFFVCVNSPYSIEVQNTKVNITKKKTTESIAEQQRYTERKLNRENEEKQWKIRTCMNWTCDIKIVFVLITKRK